MDRADLIACPIVAEAGGAEIARVDALWANLRGDDAARTALFRDGGPHGADANNNLERERFTDEPGTTWRRGRISRTERHGITQRRHSHTELDTLLAALETAGDSSMPALRLAPSSLGLGLQVHFLSIGTCSESFTSIEHMLDDIHVDALAAHEALLLADQISEIAVEPAKASSAPRI